MAVRTPRMYETHGAPQVLEQLPDPEALRAAGAERAGEAIQKAVSLRDEAARAKAAVREAERRLKAAEREDLRDQARKVAERPDTKLTAKRTEAARRQLEDAERRHRALALATEDATDRLLGEVTGDEAVKLAEAARKVRERSVQRVERAVREIEEAIADEQAALSIARWARSPESRKWRVPLGIAELNHIRIDKLVAANAALAPYLARQPVPGEEPEEPGIRFGHAAIGTVPVQPGLS
jgi:hypothetical protein